jgi:glycosyltransferase involved in cell wall biosynthesis
MSSISTIITTHGEGELLIVSVQSCNDAVKQVESLGVSVEKFLVMDRPTKETRKAVDECGASFTVIERDYGDQGLVRNDMVGIAKGDYIAFLDGDDLWSENWLADAYNKAQELGYDCVLYPEFNWYFEGSNNILCQIDESREWFDYEQLRAVNLWDALCFCPRKVYKENPFIQRNIKEGFAYEDWHWNRQIFEASIPQRIVEDTIIFKRRRIGSQGSFAQKRGVIAKPSESSYYEFFQY